MCILKLAYQQDKHRQSEGRSRWRLYLYLGRSTILRLRHIVLLVYCPSCRKRFKNCWPRIPRMKHWGMSPTSITICYKLGKSKKLQCIIWLHTNREQRKTGSYTRVLLDIETASDSTPCDITKAAHGMGLETHSSNGLALVLGGRKISHLQEKHWKGLWPSAGHRGAFYYPKLWTLVAVELTEVLGNGWYTLRYALSISVENNQCLTACTGGFG